MTNNESLLNKITVDPPMAKGDHATIVVNVMFEKNHKESMPSYFLYRKADYEAIRHHLADINWDSALKSCENVEEMWQTFCRHLLFARDKYVPQIVRNENFRERPPWLTKHLIVGSKEKKRACIPEMAQIKK